MAPDDGEVAFGGRAVRGVGGVADDTDRRESSARCGSCDERDVVRARRQHVVPLVRNLAEEIASRRHSQVRIRGGVAPNHNTPQTMDCTCVAQVDQVDRVDGVLDHLQRCADIVVDRVLARGEVDAEFCCPNLRARSARTHDERRIVRHPVCVGSQGCRTAVVDPLRSVLEEHVVIGGAIRAAQRRSHRTRKRGDRADVRSHRAGCVRRESSARLLNLDSEVRPARRVQLEVDQMRGAHVARAPLEVRGRSLSRSGESQEEQNSEREKVAHEVREGNWEERTSGLGSRRISRLETSWRTILACGSNPWGRDWRQDESGRHSVPQFEPEPATAGLEPGHSGVEERASRGLVPVGVRTTR